MRLSATAFRACWSVWAAWCVVRGAAGAGAGAGRVPKLCGGERGGEGPGGCSVRGSPRRVTCRRNLGQVEGSSLAEVVYSCRWTLEAIDPEDILRSFRFVQKLTIRDGNVTEFLTDFPRSPYLHTVALVHLNLRDLPKGLFALLQNLKVLDLSHNKLRHISPELIRPLPSLLKLSLTGNPWNCSSDLKWLLQKSVASKLADKDLVQCGGNVFPGKPVYFVMSLIKQLDEDCPAHACHCAMTNIVWDTDQSYLIPVITVNCSDRGLTTFPTKLPLNTTTLLLSRNNISTLLPVVQNKALGSVADIYLDDNRLDSVDVLEGAHWLNTFRVLSLRGNRLSQLPVYALDNAFQKNSNMASLYLGNNPWKCDCLFVPDFHHLLIKYSSVIKDKADIRCAPEEGSDLANRQVTSLSTKAVCQKPGAALNALDALSAAFAALILLLLAKLAYDCWAFKRTGHLPWIVAKMP